MKTETISSQQVFDLATEFFGLVPGIVKELAGRSTATAMTFVQGSANMEQGSFSFTELNVIELKVSLLNHCESCVKGHSYLLKKEGLPEEEIKAILEKRSLDSERLNQIIRATENIYYAGSDIFPAQVLEDLIDHFTEKEIVEIIGLIGIKTIANYTNNFLASLKIKSYA